MDREGTGPAEGRRRLAIVALAVASIAYLLATAFALPDNVAILRQMGEPVGAQVFATGVQAIVITVVAGLTIVWLLRERTVGVGVAAAVAVAVLQVPTVVSLVLAPEFVLRPWFNVLWLTAVVAWIVAGALLVPALRSLRGPRPAASTILIAGASALALGPRLPTIAFPGPGGGPFDALLYGDALTRATFLLPLAAMLAVVVLVVRLAAPAGVGAAVVLLGEGVISLTNVPAAVARPEPITVAPLITLLGVVVVGWWCVTTSRGARAATAHRSSGATSEV